MGLYIRKWHPGLDEIWNVQDTKRRCEHDKTHTKHVRIESTRLVDMSTRETCALSKKLEHATQGLMRYRKVRQHGVCRRAVLGQPRMRLACPQAGRDQQNTLGWVGSFDPVPTMSGSY